MKKVIRISSDLFSNKIKVGLSFLGISEQYKASEYLTFIIKYMIKNNNDDKQTYKNAINEISCQQSVCTHTIVNSISKLFLVSKSVCESYFGSDFTQFNNLKKIRAIKNYILTNL